MPTVRIAPRASGVAAPDFPAKAGPQLDWSRPISAVELDSTASPTVRCFQAGMAELADAADSKFGVALRGPVDKSNKFCSSLLLRFGKALARVGLD